MNSLFGSPIPHRDSASIYRNPRGGTQEGTQGRWLPFPRLPPQIPALQGFPGGGSRPSPGGSRPGQAPPRPLQRRPRPTFPGGPYGNPYPRPLGAPGNRAIATRRNRRTAKGSGLPHYGGDGVIAAGQLPDSTRIGLIVSLVDPQGARPCHRTRGRRAFAICLGLAELSRGHCTPCI
jgi:hypothetical protein